MSSITIRNLDDKLKASLRLRAARHGLSMEQEVRNILQSTLAAIALSAHLTLVTRNTKDSEGISALALINPWQSH